MANNMKRSWLGLAAVASGSSARSGLRRRRRCNGPAGRAGPPGATGPAGPAGPPGASGTVNVAFMTPEEWEASNFSATVNSVTIASPPVVEFTVVDDRGPAGRGLRDAAPPRVPPPRWRSYPNLAFAMAKLMPRTDARPATWVSYIVTSVERHDGRHHGHPPQHRQPGQAGSRERQAWPLQVHLLSATCRAPRRVVDGLTYSGNNRKEDLGDLTWAPDPAAPADDPDRRRGARHRLQHAERRAGDAGREHGQPGQRHPRLRAGHGHRC